MPTHRKQLTLASYFGGFARRCRREAIVPGHGLPGGDGLPDSRGVYASNHDCLAVAAREFAGASVFAHLNQRLEAAFPLHGRIAIWGPAGLVRVPGHGRKPLQAGLSSLADAHSAPGNRRSGYREIMAW
jgi:hypothetical protein